MPKTHPYTKEERALRVRYRAHKRYQTQKQEVAKVELSDKISSREAFARSLGKAVIPWTVEQEMALLNEYRHTCAFCDKQSDELDLTTNDPASDFCIENMLPICQPCLVNRYVIDLVPVQVKLHLQIKDLPDGYHKEWLTLLSVRDTVFVHIVAKLRKNDWLALLGLPEVVLSLKKEYRYLNSYVQGGTHTAQQVGLYGQVLFESEARALFPQYNAIAYYNLFGG